MPLAAAIILAFLISSVPLWAQGQPAPPSPQGPAQNTQTEEKPHSAQGSDVPATTGPGQTPGSSSQQPGAAQEKPATHVVSPAKTKPHRRRRPAGKPGAPVKVVVRNGSTHEPTVQISPTVSQQQAVQQRQNTSQLLGAAEANLKKISEQSLTAERKNIVEQIRGYIEGAKAAEKAGDMQRAQNLASKARLLSDDLVKPTK